MLLDFRIDWGYMYLYSRRHYHPFFEWDGSLECENGQLLKLHQLEYPVIWFGPGQCPREIPLEGNCWKSRTRRGLAGIRVEAEAEENTVFKLHTRSGDFEFTASDILEKGRLVFPVGPKYLGCSVIVTRRHYFWYRPEAAAGERVFEAADMSELPFHDWMRMPTAWLAPGAKVSLPLTVAADQHDYNETLLHIAAMAGAPGGYTPGAETVFHDDFTINIYADGVLASSVTHFFREHDTFMQMLEDVWARFQLSEGEHIITLENTHPQGYLLLNRVSFRRCGYDHCQLSLPHWAIVNEEFIGKVFAAYPDTINIVCPHKVITLEAVQGWNEFRCTLEHAGCQVEFSANGRKGLICEVYDLPSENIPVAVGYDMTIVPHDDNGFMDWLLDYTSRTQLANLVVFRSFYYAPDSYGAGNRACRPLREDLLEKWSRFCKDHHIWVEAATDFESGVFTRGAGEYLHCVGRHEYPGAVYAFDPKEPYISQDMREACQNYVKYLANEVTKAHQSGARAAFGDASGGHRYCYMAGADFVRSETMVPHTMHLCSQARPAAEALGCGEWGVHIAIHHPRQPFFETHLGEYYLSLFQPWMMGANVIYEEDSLFLLFKEERQSWDDMLTKGKRDMTRDFYKFVKTHPRSGKCVRNIAFLEGRYAAPFNGFICDSEQTPDYSVWGMFGNPAAEWGHRQPEKCRQLLDVLMPGANTQPLRQQYDKRRFFFSGTPYGDFDEVPVESASEYFEQYKLLLNLGWNTFESADWEKLENFVRKGGVLLTGIPQFSTHVKRDFLRDFDDLALWNHGDLAAAAGFRVKGRGAKFSGQWNCKEKAFKLVPELSSAPSCDINEDDEGFVAAIELAGAEVVVYDSSSAEPLLVRYKLGKGWVYTLTFWAYPGHEKFQRLSAAVIAALAKAARPEYYLEDPSKELFWTLWQQTSDNAQALLMILNTDWTSKNNTKKAVVHAPDWSFELEVTERKACFVRFYQDKALVSDPSLHIACDSDGSLIACGSGKTVCTVINRDGSREEKHFNFEKSTALPFVL
ncbi:MAG: hypothetical protein E7056_06760 [Lentisphaerae bacterium]|nr:hypothetical protein [Lentisphaerota bacterium]